MVLTTIGNNDGYHSQAIDESHKYVYYRFLFDLWISGFPGNKEISNSAFQTFMSAGYYRADVSDTVSVLVLNTEYFNESADDSLYNGEPAEIL